MRFVIVTGMSGAGRGTALRILEDAGYFCVDNLPVPLTPLKADEKQEIRNSTHWRGVLAR